MYLMESDREAQRLEAKTDLKKVRERLELVQLASGMRVLDAGAGSGAIAKVMCEMVAPTGEVIALEKSRRRVEFISSRAKNERLVNLKVVQADVYSPPLQTNTFDMVWCEFVFEYLNEPARAARALAELVSPGGKLVLADLDGNGTFHYPFPQHVAEKLEAVLKALRPNFDPFAGRKLYYWLRKAGLEEIRVHMLPYHFYPGAAGPKEIDHWRIKFETIRPLAAAAVGGAEVFDEWVCSYLEMLQDPDRFSYSILFLAEGRKPECVTND